MISKLYFCISLTFRSSWGLSLKVAFPTPDCRYKFKQTSYESQICVYLRFTIFRLTEKKVVTPSCWKSVAFGSLSDSRWHVSFFIIARSQSLNARFVLLPRAKSWNQNGKGSRDSSTLRGVDLRGRPSSLWMEREIRSMQWLLEALAHKCCFSLLFQRKLMLSLLPHLFLRSVSVAAAGQVTAE